MSINAIQYIPDGNSYDKDEIEGILIESEELAKIIYEVLLHSDNSNHDE